MLSELHGESAPGRAVKAGKEAFHYAGGSDLQMAEPGNFPGIEQVEAGS
jgi:hypothetical protein